MEVDPVTEERDLPKCRNWEVLISGRAAGVLIGYGNLSDCCKVCVLFGLRVLGC